MQLDDRQVETYLGSRFGRDPAAAGWQEAS